MAKRLYPPLINYSMPAFDKDNEEGVNIYFALSSFNIRTEIKQAHATVRYQSSNANALSSVYPAKIKICSINEAADGRYFINLKSTDLDGGFKAEQLYKVQIRFSSSTGSATLDYFNSHLDDFSEWSTVCLIKPITRPTVSIDGLGSTWTKSIPQFTIRFVSNNRTETLKQWRLKLISAAGNITRADSGLKVFNSYDGLVTDAAGTVGLKYNIQYELLNNTRYFLYLTTITTNDFEQTQKYDFTTSFNVIDIPSITVMAEPQDDHGFMKITIQGSSLSTATEVQLRRAAAQTNFSKWQTLSVLTLSESITKAIYPDYSAEAGTYYKYGVQIVNSSGDKSNLIKSDTPIACDFNDAFLIEGTSHLKLEYNFNVTSLNINTMETKVDMLGSKYPFITRNADTYYKTLQLSGLLSAYMNIDSMFIDERKNFYGGLFNQGGTSIIKNNELANVSGGVWLITTKSGQEATVRGTTLYINDSDTQYGQIGDMYYRYDELGNLHTGKSLDEIATHNLKYDYNRERHFRETVMNFLADGQPKLFKSTQQGNILGYIMTPTFTPFQSVDRLLYTFSASFVEIDDCTVANLKKYNII